MVTSILGALFIILTVAGIIYGQSKSGAIGAVLLGLTGAAVSFMIAAFAGLILPSSWLY